LGVNFARLAICRVRLIPHYFHITSAQAFPQRVLIQNMLEFTKPKLVPLGVMARRLHVPTRWLRGEAEAGRVPCLRAERAFLFDPEAVEKVLLERAGQMTDKAIAQ